MTSAKFDDPGKNPAGGKKASRRGWWLAGAVAALVLAVLGYNTLGKAQSAKEGRGAPLPVPVVAVPAQVKDLDVRLSALGTVTALNTVTVRSRVDGQLMEVHFQEGQNVKQGELLCQIDPRPYEVQLTQAQGQLMRDQSLLQNARLDLKRYQDLWSQDATSRQQLDTQEALVRQYEGTVKNDQGQIDSAKLNITYCRITAPLSGRVGLRLVDQGNMVHASDSGGLLVITQVRPISLVFAIPEDSLPQVLAKMRQGGKLAVEAWDRDQRHRLAVGSLLTMDNQIDTGTGTVKLKALFPNKGDELFPNQFVNARLVVDVLAGSLVVPAQAVQRGAQGPFVYALTPEQTATVKKVKLGPTTDGLTVVVTGLEAGDQVVVDGADRLREGAKVEIRGQDKAPDKGGAPAADKGTDKGADKPHEKAAEKGQGAAGSGR